MREQWLNKLRDKMADYEEPSPEGLWDNIENAMLEQKPKGKRVSIAPVKWRVASLVAAVLALAMWLGYEALYIHNGGVNGEPAPISLSTSEMPIKGEEMQNINAQSPERLAHNSSQIILKKHALELGAEDNTAIDTITTTTAVAHAESDGSHSKGIQTAINKDGDKHRTDAINAMRTEGKDKRVANIAFNKSKRDAGNWTINIHESNVTAASNKVNGYSRMPMSGGVMLSDDETTSNGGLMDAILFNQNKEASTEVHHRLPIKVGVTVNIPLTKRWSVETGLTYTYLSSQITSGSDSYGYVSEQKLHYLGIPVNVNYKIWSYKKFDLYASAGGAVEKCVSGNLSTDYVINSSKEQGKSESVMVKQVQCSANASVGFQLNLTPNIGIYAEPGAGYYFDNGSDVPTIYSEKPLNFNLRMGVRVTL